MFEPYGQDGPTNAFRYRNIPVRFTYLLENGADHVAQVDIDGVLPEDTEETRFHRLRGPWKTREEALAAAQDWAKSWLDIVLGKGAKEG
ncbi:hypothetical protein J3Q09_17705 [Pseudomonas sp. R4-83]|uniref:hypothetical protein n=1 Tax=unclassified Pseudomonas TaxID=196821 RepID=UPI003DAA054C